MKTTLYLNIGSNSGDRRAFIARAVDALLKHFGHDSQVRVSSPFESAPWGFESANQFVNVGVTIDTNIDEPWTETSLHQLLDTIKDIEKSISSTPHRNADGSYRDREVDIDIIAVDELDIDTPRLTIPHKCMHLREFVIVPMAELAPEWRHPRLEHTVAEILGSMTLS